MALLFRHARIRAPQSFSFYSSTLFRANSTSLDDEKVAQARKWLSSFTEESIPRRSCEITFSRSSGPGGQNVNKINSKATLRLSLRDNAGFMPNFILQKVRENSNYLTKNDEIVIQSDNFRTQSQNVDECFRRLHDSIRGCIQLPGETSPEQKKHVTKLQKEENERRIKMKKMHSNKKSARRSQGGDY
ncbi:hypothetical protein RUND412_007937 [Rhizina undulata]